MRNVRNVCPSSWKPGPFNPKTSGATVASATYQSASNTRCARLLKCSDHRVRFPSLPNCGSPQFHPTPATFNQMHRHPSMSPTSSDAHVTRSDALVSNSFLLLLLRHLLLVAMHMLLEAMHLFLIASCYYY